MANKANKLFVWRKKIEREVSKGVTRREKFSKRRREMMAELENLRRKREAREVAKARRKDKRVLLERERAHAEFLDVEKKEERFLFEQCRLRSKIRVKEGRMKPIDILLNYIARTDNIVDTDIDIDKRDIEPYNVLKDLELKELEELREDVEMYINLDRSTPMRVRYWEAVMVVCEWELTRARDRGGSFVEDRGLHPSVAADVENLLLGKSYGELEKFRSQIELEMISGTALVVEYWEVVLKRLHIFKAKACLREIHHQLSCKHVVRLEKPSDDKDVDQESDIEGNDVCGSTEEGDVGNRVESEVYWGHDEYQSKKPKYVNRVHTGYEWNKYNRTHYDHDNPPPKSVQGYKFNIFYPDLVDKSRAPSYTVLKDGGSSETCIILFHAGLPYEDIAFRIVNKEWEYYQKKEFKCAFEGGVLRLYFNFKRCPCRR